ncbi:MAG: NUDIX domain-containing protein [Parachlamydiales bacterium]|jgi:8-oxo-dGTP pyrophosphatase MutT (NUDIX family)
MPELKASLKKLDLTVGACLVFENRVLLLFHTKLKKWLFPGGHIEPNETPDQAVVREVKEETGLDLEFLEFSPLVQREDEIQKLALPFHANQHSVGDHEHYCVYYLAKALHPHFVQNHESQALKWFGREDLQAFDGLLPSVRQMALLALKKSGAKPLQA